MSTQREKPEDNGGEFGARKVSIDGEGKMYEFVTVEGRDVQFG